MNNDAFAFFIGLFGGLHCVAMCGPLVMAMPYYGQAMWLQIVQRAVYQLGRICTYGVLGLLAGLAGQGFHILGLQQYISLATGLFLLVIAYYQFSGTKSRLTYFQTKLVNPIAKGMGKLFSKPYGGFFAGMLHGLLPCGMVYMALAGSLNTASALAGSRFMFFFGMGTTPLLLAVSLLPVALKRFKTPRFALPALYLLAGAFLLARGFNVEIPFVSASINLRSPSAVCR